MDKEFLFWMVNRTEVKREGGKDYTVAVYNVEVDGPRPGNNKHKHCNFPQNGEKIVFFKKNL